MKIIRLILLVLVLLPVVASAHQDRILTVRVDGSIPEIPASFGVVSLNISGLGSKTPTVKFKSGDKTTAIPACLARYIHSKTTSDVFVTGSWYHSESVIPYYVSVQFLDPGHAETKPYNSNTSILFNLRTAQIIDVTRLIANRSGSSAQYLKIDLPQGCLPQEHTT